MPNKQEKLVDGEDWRSILEKEETAQTPANEKLELIAGDWSMEFLDNGTPYDFERYGEKVNGVAFIVNAKHISSGGNFPEVSWGVTAKSLLKLISSIKNVTGYKLVFTATSSGMQRRYSLAEIFEPKKRTRKPQ